MLIYTLLWYSEWRTVNIFLANVMTTEVIEHYNYQEDYFCYILLHCLLSRCILSVVWSWLLVHQNLQPSLYFVIDI